MMLVILVINVLLKIIHNTRIFCRSIILLEEFNCLHVDWTVKKSEKKLTALNYWIDYTNERGKPNRCCHKPALKCFCSFYFSVENGRWSTITQKCFYAYKLLNITGIYLSESCKKSNGVVTEKINICTSLIYLDKTRPFTLLKCLYVCVHLLAINKKSLQTVYSLIL